LARPTQGFDLWSRRVFLWVSLCMTASLAACGTKGFSFEDAVPDTALTTGSVPGSASPTSDEGTIRDAVSSAIVDDIGDDGIGWANAGSGSRGTIRNVRESRDAGGLCRDFSATRESYEGVFLYQGKACMGPSKMWSMHQFDRVE
jgi:predicted small lipoprotein YifL